MEAIEVSVIIPCLNEEKTVARCIEIARGAMQRAGIPGEVVISDNGSTDQSVAIAEKNGARVVHAARKGYGNALICGMRAAKGKYLVMGDADGSYDFDDIPKFISKLKDGADFVIGSRLKGTIHPGAMPLLNRYLGTPVLTGLINLFFKTRITDVNCGLRALSKKAFDSLRLKAGGMEFASEMVIKASLLGLKVVEVPTALFPDRRDRPPHLRPFRDGWRHLRFLLLFTPTWLFFIPGLVSLLSGCLILAAMLLFEFKNFGFFTMLFGQGLVLLGAQIIFLGIAARSYSHLKSFLPRKDPVDRFLIEFTIEKGVAIGAIVSAGGIAICAWVGYKLLAFMAEPANVGVFNFPVTKMGIIGATFAILGFQIIFSSFYSGLFNVQVIGEDPPDEQW